MYVDSFCLLAGYAAKDPAKTKEIIKLLKKSQVSFSIKKAPPACACGTFDLNYNYYYEKNWRIF